MNAVPSQGNQIMISLSPKIFYNIKNIIVKISINIKEFSSKNINKQFLFLFPLLLVRF